MPADGRDEPQRTVFGRRAKKRRRGEIERAHRLIHKKLRDRLFCISVPHRLGKIAQVLLGATLLPKNSASTSASIRLCSALTPKPTRRAAAIPAYAAAFVPSNIRPAADSTPKMWIARSRTREHSMSSFLELDLTSLSIWSISKSKAVNGIDLQDQWREHPEALYGLATSNFPNMFMCFGPNTATLWSSVHGEVYSRCSEGC